LRYSGHYPHLRFLWRAPCFIKIVFTLTWDIPVLNTFHYGDKYRIDSIELRNLDVKSLRKVSERVTKYYKEAYNFQPRENPFNFIPEKKREQTRSLIKSMIEALDLIRFHPVKSAKTLLR